MDIVLNATPYGQANVEMIELSGDHHESEGHIVEGCRTIRGTPSMMMSLALVTTNGWISVLLMRLLTICNEDVRNQFGYH